MANPADEWSSADLGAVARGGIIHEDVMNKIWDISNVPLPFTSRIGSDNVGNSLATWTQDKLGDPDLTNKVVDGADATGNNAKGGKRVGNHCQISTKNVSVTQRARASNTIGRSDELSYQVAERQKELRRDREAIMLNNQASVADDGDTVAGTLGGLPSWIETVFASMTDGTAGGYDTGTGLTVAATDGTTAGAISEVAIRDAMQAIYQNGGEASVLMSTPDVIRKISEYMFTDGARIATLTSDAMQKASSLTATGSVNLFVTDFGTLELVPNRIQQGYTTPTAVDVFLLDTALLRIGTLEGYRVDPLAKTGLADKREMSVDATLKVLNEEGLGIIRDVDPAAAMVAG